jgi:hypothetical protein
VEPQVQRESPVHKVQLVQTVHQVLLVQKVTKENEDLQVKMQLCIQ